MRIFIYHWEIPTEGCSRFHIYGFGLGDSGEKITVDVTGFKPYCYIPSANSREIERLSKESGIEYMGVEYKHMASTSNISKKEHYARVEFLTIHEMKSFCYKTRNKCMDDVDPITSFLSYYQFPFVGWFEVGKFKEKDGYVKVSAKDLKVLKNEIKMTRPKIACIDIEVVSSDGIGMPKPYKRGDRIEMISVVCKEYLSKEFTKYLVYIGEGMKLDSVECVGCLDEIEVISQMVEILKREDPEIITGYNIFGFDMGYILARMKLRLCLLPDMSRGKYGRTTTRKVNWSSSAYGQNTYDRIEASGRVFIDLMLFFRRMKLDKYSLDFVSRKYLGDGKKDMSPNTMFRYFRNRDKDGLRLVGEYCIHDSVLTLLLFDKFFIWTDVCEMSRAMRCSIEDIYTRGEQLKVLNQIIFKCSERDIVLVRRKDGSSEFKYEGAFVLDPQKGIFEGCTVVDFQSLYPSVLISYNLCPSTYIPSNFLRKESINEIHVGENKVHFFRKEPIGLLPDLAQGLLAERFLVKADLKKVTDDLTKIVLDRRQNALKVCANSIYGITGFASNKYFGHVPTAESITSMGRQMLETTVGKIRENFNVSVVYGDTDSCMIYHNGEKDREKNIRMANEIVEYINKGLPKPLKLLVEKYYEKMAFLTKKRYLMYDGENITTKGVANSRRNYCTFTRNLYANTIKIMFENEDPNDVFGFVFDEVLRLVRGEVSNDELTMTKSIKPLESYKSVSVPHVVMYRRLIAEGNVFEIGNRLEFLFVDLGYKSKLQGNKMYTPKEVENESLTIDYLYYVEKQLLIAMDELLSLLKRENYIGDLYNMYKMNRGW